MLKYFMQNSVDLGALHSQEPVVVFSQHWPPNCMCCACITHWCNTMVQRKQHVHIKTNSVKELH